MNIADQKVAISIPTFAAVATALSLVIGFAAGYITVKEQLVRMETELVAARLQLTEEAVKIAVFEQRLKDMGESIAEIKLATVPRRDGGRDK